MSFYYIYPRKYHANPRHESLLRDALTLGSVLLDLNNGRQPQASRTPSHPTTTSPPSPYHALSAPTTTPPAPHQPPAQHQKVCQFTLPQHPRRTSKERKQEKAPKSQAARPSEPPSRRARTHARAAIRRRLQFRPAAPDPWHTRYRPYKQLFCLVESGDRDCRLSRTRTQAKQSQLLRMCRSCQRSAQPYATAAPSAMAALHV